MKLNLLNDDITSLAVDAIVNAANSSLLGGGGVDGAIHRQGGPAILDACMAIRAAQGGCGTGEAVITTAGRLPAGYVIHTVGPVWNGGNSGEVALLASCYRSCLKLCVTHGIQTVAFPNISTGIYRFPKLEAAKIAIAAVKACDGGGVIEGVTFVCFDAENYEIYQDLL